MAPSSSSPRVLAIVVNWNKKAFLERLLEDLRGLERPPDEIVAVDNASEDGSAEMVRQRFPGVRLLANERNLGGSGGFNAGMRWGLEQGGFQYFWLLDNDVVVHPGALQALLDAAEADPRAGLVGSRIAELHHPERTQEVGATIHWPTCFLVKIGAGPAFPPPGQGDRQVFEADYVAACSALARVEAIEQAGIWDEGYFVFFDDIDWGVRIRRAGWKVIAASASLVEHESFIERRLAQGPGATHLCLRNAIYFMHRFCPPRWRPRLLFRVIHFSLKEALAHWLDGRPEAARALWLGVWDFLLSRRGKSARSFRDDALACRLAQSGPAPRDAVPCGKQRLLLWSHSCSEETEQAIEAVAAAFPDHRIDVFAAAETHELDGWERPGLIRRPAESFRDRLALARWALARYDAIVREERRSRLAFERLFPWVVWFSLAGDVGAARNKRWHAWAALAARPAILAASAALAALALLKPRARVDYFTWRGARTPRR